MDLLTLISQEIIDVKPHIEAGLDGRWRLKERYMISGSGTTLIYAREPLQEDLFLCIGRGLMVHFCDNTLPLHLNQKDTYEFDPQTGLLHNKSGVHYLRIELLTSGEMTLLDLRGLESGSVIREHFERV